MKSSYLLIDLGQLFAVVLDVRLGPLLYHGEVAEQLHTRHGDTSLIATQEEPDGQQRYACDERQ